jgi:hypothetical protein
LKALKLVCMLCFGLVALTAKVLFVFMSLASSDEDPDDALAFGQGHTPFGHSEPIAYNDDGEQVGAYSGSRLTGV